MIVEQPVGLTAEAIRKEELKKNRNSLSSSLIGFSIEDVTRTHRVKSEFNMRTSGGMNAGQMFSCLNAQMKIGGLLNEDLMQENSRNDDTRSTSALSFISNSIFNPMNRTISGFSMHNFSLDR